MDVAARLAKVARGLPAAAAVLTPAGTELHHFGCRPGDDFEIGSISKAVTGLLYCDALARGEVAPTTALGELLPLPAQSPAAEIRLADLATHRSGLPRVVGERVFGRSVDYLRHGSDPFDQPLAEFYAAAGAAKLRPGRTSYSNAGFQLLGHALAAAAGVSYVELLRLRLAEPLGLDPFFATRSAADLRPGSLPGHNRGKVVAPWASEALGPAGGVRASAEALAGFAKACLDGSAPGLAALEPVADFAGRAVRIGAGWIVTDRKEKGVLTWHNGGTGGNRSWLGLRRDAGIAVLVLGASTHAVDRLGLSLLASSGG